MTTQPKSSRVMHLALWVAQAVLAAGLLWAGVIKLFQPVSTVATMWPWAGQVPVALVKLTGMVDLLAAIGLILPALIRVGPKLTPMAALGIIALMLCAGIFHIVRGEASQIGVNLFFAVVAAFIAWGRFSKAPIAAKKSVSDLR